MALEQFKNSPFPSSPSTPWTLLSGAINDSVTSITFLNSASFPAVAQFRILIDDELMLVTAGAGDIKTVTRGVDGTNASTHADGAGIYHILTAGSLANNPRSMTTAGDVEYLASSGSPARLAIGASHTAMISDGSLPSWGKLSTSHFTSGAISQWTNDSNYIAFAGLASPPNGTALGANATPFATLNLAGAGNPGGYLLALKQADEGPFGIVFSNDLSATYNGIYVDNSGNWIFLANADAQNASLTWSIAGVAWHFVGGPVTAPNLSGTNTGDQDLSSYATKSYANAGDATVLASIPAAAMAFTNKTGAISQWTNDSSYTTLAIVNAQTLAVFAATTSLQLKGVISDETGSGALVFANTPTLVTPVLGVATATSINGNVFTTGTYTLTGTAGKTLTFSKSLTLDGTDGTTMTFPATSATLARTDATNTFTGVQGFSAALTDTLAINATSTDGLVLTNTTAATVGAQQWSPRIRLTGQGWKTTVTAASQTVDWIIENQPVQGSANPSTNLVVSSQVNNAGYVSQATFTSAGGFNTTGSISAGTNGTFLSTFVVGARSDGQIGFTSSSFGSGTIDTFLTRDGAGVFAQRNATAAQAFNLYNTFTDASNYERLGIGWNVTSNTLTIGATGAGTGSVRTLQMLYGGTTTSAIQIGSGTTSGISLAGTSVGTAVTNGRIQIAFAVSTSATVGTHQTMVIGDSASTNTTSTVVFRSLRIAPSINYANVTPGAGSYEMLSIGVTETALPTGTCYLIRASAGVAGTTDKFSVQNTGTTTWADAANFIFGSTTGTKFGTATSQKIGFYNATPVVQRADMSALTDSTTGTPSTTLNDVGVAFSQAAVNNNFASVLIQVNKVRTALRDLGLMA